MVRRDNGTEPCRLFLSVCKAVSLSARAAFSLLPTFSTKDAFLLPSHSNTLLSPNEVVYSTALWSHFPYWGPFLTVPSLVILKTTLS